MDKFPLTAKQMQIVMAALRADPSDEAAELHDELAHEGFNSFDNELAAELHYKDR